MESRIVSIESNMTTKSNLNEVESKMDLKERETNLQNEIIQTRTTVVPARNLLLENGYHRLENVDAIKKKLEQVVTG